MINIDKNLPIKVSTRIIRNVKVSDNNSAYLKLESLAEVCFNDYQDVPVSQGANIQNERITSIRKKIFIVFIVTPVYYIDKGFCL